MLEKWAPLPLQEKYDNAGLLVGSNESTVTGVMVSLDCTEAVVDEAIAAGCNMVVSHHPLIFGGLKRLTGANHIERTVLKAIRKDVALYAIHTNLDNVASGVNKRIADRLGLTNPRILQPKSGRLRKLAVFCPHKAVEAVRSALFAAGAGAIGNYDECSFNLEGSGTFRAREGSNPTIGQLGERHTEPETRIEVIYPQESEARVLKAMVEAHPYEEVAHDIVPLDNVDQTTGAGMVGDVETPLSEQAFLEDLKERMKTHCVRYTALRHKQVSRVAVCGGSGSFLLSAAKAAGADVFITGDFKYHDFFHAEGDIVIADIGHFESEQFTIDHICAYLADEAPDLQVRPTSIDTNPIHYL